MLYNNVVTQHNMHTVTVMCTGAIQAGWGGGAQKQPAADEGTAEHIQD